MERLKILIVDDEYGIQAGIRRALRNFKVSFPFHDDDFEFDLIDAGTGEDAISIIESEAVDIVLLDNKLPGIEGIEVLEYIKEKKYDLAVIMITSYASIDLAVKATNSGAFNFVPKPFTSSELKAAVESVTKHVFLKRMTRQMKSEEKEIRFQFLSVLSHELKSPINAVEGYLRIMADKQLGDDISTYQKMIDRSISRITAMRTLIMDMLDFTRVESGKKSRTIKENNLLNIAGNALESIEPTANSKNVTINKHFPEELNIFCDAGEMEIIFNNLLSNAVKYNKDNGHVDFSMIKENDHLKIEMKDTGIGMSETEKSNLFKEFMRAKNKNTKNITGTGLGLSILKKIVDLNKGSVAVETEMGVGSMFIVKLPVN